MLDYVDSLHYKNPKFIVVLVFFSILDAKELSITSIKVFFLCAFSRPQCRGVKAVKHSSRLNLDFWFISISNNTILLTMLITKIIQRVDITKNKFSKQSDRM